jgi:hypothetical protein
MGVAQEKATGNIGQGATATGEADPRVSRIDPTAPAGSKNSLGAESIRDGRPGTDDDTVEAIDEVGPEVTAP